MRVLLDENLDQRFKPLFDDDFVVLTVDDCGWKGIQNGVLLRAAQEAHFDVFVTRDRNLIHQQNLAKYDLAFIILRPRSGAYREVLPLIPAANRAIRSIWPQAVVIIESPV